MIPTLRSPISDHFPDRPKPAISGLHRDEAAGDMPSTDLCSEPGDEPDPAFADRRGVDLRVCFGNNFRAARQRAKLTQKDIEQRTGIKQHYVSQLELGKQNPTLGTMIALAQAVGKDVSGMLKPPMGTTRKKVASPSDSALVE